MELSTGRAGWGNGELQHYTSARLTTQFKGDWTFCRIEIRARLPNTQGIWPAFWMLPTRARYGGGAVGGEIAIMEYVDYIRIFQQPSK
jgi:beta-glucanase (GH16 family)